MNIDSFITNFTNKETPAFESTPLTLEKAALWVHQNPVASKVVEAAGNIWRGFGLLLPPHHEMRRHTFEPASYGAGRLYYQGDIPILELDYADSRKAGFAHGYLMGKYLNRLLDAFQVAESFSPLPSGIDPKDIPTVLAELKSKFKRIY